MEFCIHENINTLIENFSNSTLHHFQNKMIFGIEVVISSKDNFSSISEKTLERLSENLKPFVRSGHLPFRDLHIAGTDSYIMEYSRNNIKKGLEIAHRLGIKKCVAHTGFSPLLPKKTFKEKWFPKFMAAKKEIEEFGLTHEITIAWENVWEKDFMLFDMILNDSPETHLCCDVGHANCFSDFTPEDFIKKYKKNISHIHLHDNIGKEDEHLPLGEGNIEFDRITSLIDKKNISHITFELNKNDFIKSFYLIEQIIKSYSGGTAK